MQNGAIWGHFRVSYSGLKTVLESFQDIIIYQHMKCRKNRTMLNLCGIVAVILKMATGRNFSLSGRQRNISTGRHFQNGHHNTAQIQQCSISTS
jgi:hypothetical protein